MVMYVLRAVRMGLTDELGAYVYALGEVCRIDIKPELALAPITRTMALFGSLSPGPPKRRGYGRGTGYGGLGTRLAGRFRR